MEYMTCATCNLQNKRSNEFKQRLTNRLPAASREYYCQQCHRILNSVDETYHLKSEEQKKYGLSSM